MVSESLTFATLSENIVPLTGLITRIYYTTRKENRTRLEIPHTKARRTQREGLRGVTSYERGQIYRY